MIKSTISSYIKFSPTKLTQNEQKPLMNYNEAVQIIKDNAELFNDQSSIHYSRFGKSVTRYVHLDADKLKDSFFKKYNSWGDQENKIKFTEFTEAINILMLPNFKFIYRQEDADKLHNFIVDNNDHIENDMSNTEAAQIIEASAILLQDLKGAIIKYNGREMVQYFFDVNKIIAISDNHNIVSQVELWQAIEISIYSPIQIDFQANVLESLQSFQTDIYNVKPDVGIIG